MLWCFYILWPHIGSSGKDFWCWKANPTHLHGTEACPLQMALDSLNIVAIIQFGRDNMETSVGEAMMGDFLGISLQIWPHDRWKPLMGLGFRVVNRVVQR